jgi:hypothetical protein
MASKDKEEKRKKLIFKFNTVVEGMIKHIVDKYKDPQFSKIKMIFDIFVSQHSKDPINMFLKKVYSNDKYRHNLLEENEEFFMNNNYDDVPEEEKNDAFKYIFHFKELWQQISPDTKIYIKKSMYVLVKICEEYLLV